MRQIFAISILFSTLAFSQDGQAAVSFVCQSPKITNSSWKGSDYTLGVTQECEALIQMRSDFKSSAVAGVFLSYIQSAPVKKLASEGALPQNGYQKVYQTTRTEKNTAGSLNILATETLNEFPERVAYSNKSSKITGTGLAGNIRSTDVNTELKVIQKSNSLLAIKYTSSNSGVVNKPFLIPGGVFTNTVQTTVTSELAKRTTAIIREIESKL